MYLKLNFEGSVVNLEKFFELKKNNTTVRTEVIAGITTFVTMAYIIFVNPNVLTATLGTTVDISALKNSIFMATCLSSFIGTLMMALYAKIPFAQAPGMGLNAFFAYTIIGVMGYTFNQGLAIVFVSGILFIIITLMGLRELIVKAIPANIKFAISAGIGFFIAFIGFSNSGIIIANPATKVGLANFANFQESKTALLAIIGIIIIGILLKYKVKGSILIGILATTIIGIPFGITDFSHFAIISLPPSMAPTFMQLDFNGLLKLGADANMWTAVISLTTIIISFTLVDMFDTIGTLVGTAEKAGLTDKNGNLPSMKKALMADAVATTAGALLGTSTVTTYIESGAGISEGGKTGLTSLVTAILFIFALFFAPLVGLIPAAATAPALIVVGVLMMSALKNINFDDMTEAIPAFLTMILMPFTYSIATGIAAGLIVYPIMKTCTGKYKEVHPIAWVLAILFILRFTIMPK